MNLVLICCLKSTGSPAVGPYLVPLLAPLGTIVVVGRIEEPVPVNFDMMLMKKASIKGSRYFSLSDFQRAVELISSGNIPAEALIESGFLSADLMK